MSGERIEVALGRRSYPVTVSAGWPADVGAALGVPGGSSRALVVSQAPVAAAGHVGPVVGALIDHGLDVDIVEVPDGEAAKDVAVLTQLWQAAADLPLARHDVIVAVGGGVVGDLAGFAAASYHRGIDVVQVPTTLLAQVDAAIGGKTGINLPQGKNLVGAFHQPRAVLCDVATLTTLPARVLTEGLGEVVKYGLIADPGLLDVLEERWPVGGSRSLDDAGEGSFGGASRQWSDGRSSGVADGSPGVEPSLALLEELVLRSVRVKAAVVAADEREGGQRAHLNLGHTYGHAVEALTGYRSVLHGEAVAIGMCVALRLGRQLGRTDDALIERVESLLARLGLPTRGPELDRDEVWRAMAGDKKVDASGVRFVVVDEPGHPALITPPPEAVDAALDEVAGGA